MVMNIHRGEGEGGLLVCRVSEGRSDNDTGMWRVAPCRGQETAINAPSSPWETGR